MRTHKGGFNVIESIKVGCAVIVVFTILIIISVRYLIKWSDFEEESLKRPIMAVICCIVQQQ